MANLTRDRFKTGTDPYGRRWQRLAPSTLASQVRPGRTRADYGTKPLVRTGGSANSFFVKSASSQQVTVASSAAHLQYHQGRDGQRGNRLPKRSFFPEKSRGFSREYRETLLDTVEDFLDGR